MSDNESIGPASFADYAGVVWRRRLIVAVAVVGVPLVAVALSYLQSAQYRATADVLLRTENLAATLSGVPDPSLGQDPARLLDTQAKLARTPAVARSAVASSGVRMTPREFLDQSAVSADPGADILTFAALAGTPAAAVELANAYAAAYSQYRTELDVGPVRQALATVNARMARLRASGGAGTDVFASLLDRQQQLASIRDLRSQSAIVVDPAGTAARVRPRPILAAAVGLLAGLFLGVGIALVRDFVEKRPRSAEELQQRLGLRVLGRIPTTSEGGQGLVTLLHPESVDAEAYRLLRMNVEHAAEHRGGVLALTSALAGEGKTTVAANLGIALAQAGRDVIVVDGDPVRPTLSGRFKVKAGPGLMDIASGRASIEEALVRFPLPPIPGNHGGSPAPLVSIDRDRIQLREWGSANKLDPRIGSLRVLASSPTPVELSNYLVATKLEHVLDRLRSEADVVIVDAAPLTTSFGIGVAGLADTVVVVVNLRLMRRPVLHQMAATLEELDTPAKGLVFTGLSPDATLTYGYPQAPVQTSVSIEGAVASADPNKAEKNRWSSAL